MTPAIILVEPQMGENIGATARAMANFALSDLRLVAPRDGWPNDRAVANAAGALDDKVNTQIYETLGDACADIQYLLATTARPRDMVKPVLSPDKAAEKITDLKARNTKCGILFGRERNGLENDEIAKAHAIITIPTAPDFSSINLSQSVLLLAYECFLTSPSLPVSVAREPLATQAELDNFLNRLDQALSEGGFFRSEGLKPTMQRNIANIFTRNKLSVQEVKTLQGILTALLK